MIFHRVQKFNDLPYLGSRHGQNQQRPVVKKSQRLRGRCKKITTASRFRRCNSKSYNGQAV